MGRRSQEGCRQDTSGPDSRGLSRTGAEPDVAGTAAPKSRTRNREHRARAIGLGDQRLSILLGWQGASFMGRWFKPSFYLGGWGKVDRRRMLSSDTESLGFLEAEKWIPRNAPVSDELWADSRQTVDQTVVHRPSRPTEGALECSAARRQTAMSETGPIGPRMASSRPTRIRHGRTLVRGTNSQNTV